MAAARSEIFETLKMLTPYEVAKYKKRRLGPKHDGGYVILDAPGEFGCLYSFSAGSNADFESDFAALGNEVHAFDSVMDHEKTPHPNLRFEKRDLVHAAEGQAVGAVLTQLLADRGHSERDDMVLKLNTEGAEWSMVREIEPSLLVRFRQLIIEGHWLLRLNEPAFRAAVRETLAALNKDFVLCHVHANNNRPVQIVDGFAIPDVVELTYLRRDLAESHVSTTLYPTRLDASNNPGSPDHLLWFFPFLPGASIAEEQAAECIKGSVQPSVEHHIKEVSNEILDYEEKLISLKKTREALWGETL